MSKNGFQARFAGDGVVEMEFYGVIGPSLEDDYIYAPQVLRELKGMGKVDKLVLLMNSPGGDVYDGFQIANRLDKLREDGQIGSIETHAEGLVASAATLPFLKGDRRVMRNGSRMMIHKPWMFGMGNAEDMRAAATRLDQTEQEALDLYESISALTREEIAAAMAVETFYTPKEAEAVGFATEVAEPFALAACMSRSLRLRFKHLPDDLQVLDWDEVTSQAPPADPAAELRELAAAHGVAPEALRFLTPPA
ncbi:MAG: Clp protease ClpP [Deltaproteobacteria bacterium]|nr:Clp protease ClpP [Deltaproteobacteria bacterium]